jgi:hypothetical protein
MIVRHVLLVGVLLATVACDTMITDRIEVAPPVSPRSQGPAGVEIHAAVRDTLTSLGLRPAGSFGDAEEWVWRDPDKPPGLHATVRRVGDGVHVRLSRDLFGPIRPTEKYRAVKKGFLEAMEQRFGKASVRIE